MHNKIFKIRYFSLHTMYIFFFLDTRLDYNKE